MAKTIKKNTKRIAQSKDLKSNNSNTKKLNVLILGGGLSGLVAAKELSETGKFNVKIIEGAPFLGGLAASFDIEGEQVPIFNHHIVSSNHRTIEYLKKYDLMGNNKWKRIKMGFGVNGKLHNINNPFGLLRFNELSLWGRFRLGLFGAYTIFLLNPNKIDEKLDLDTWMSKYAGREVTDKVWAQLYGRNKFNIPLKQISAKQFANRLYEKEGYDKFTFPTKGLEGMIDGLEKDVKKNGGKIVYPVKITHLDVKNNTIKYVELEKSSKDLRLYSQHLKNSESHNGIEHSESYDIIINTIPVPELLNFTIGLPKSYVDSIKKLRYVPVVGLCWGSKDYPNDKMYWINLFKERVHVIYQHSIIIDKYKSKITWCVRYGGSEEDLHKSDAEVKKLYLETLYKYFPDMKVKWCYVFREKYAEPVYDKDYAKYAPKYETPIPNMFNAGIQVTFPKIRNMNVALDSGEIVAKKIIEKFG